MKRTASGRITPDAKVLEDKILRSYFEKSNSYSFMYIIVKKKKKNMAHYNNSNDDYINNN